ncbi:hypothetical protein JTB14_024829 [Gonioctena quinquepunctata]|nr:hypothetical protein JTB14_024829 [Gonioctena quinquepunctata]
MNEELSEIKHNGNNPQNSILLERQPGENCCSVANMERKNKENSYSACCYLKKLQDRILFYVIDSVIKVSEDGESQYKIPTGEFFGNMLVEYGAGSYICEFDSGASKNYTCEVVLPSDERNITCKVEGMRLDHNKFELVNLEVMRNMVLGDMKDSVKVLFHSILRTNKHKIVT